MKNNTLFGIAAIIFATGFLLQSIPFAKAVPQTSNISLGSNPIFSQYFDDCSTTSTSITVPTDQVLVITDITTAAFDTESITIYGGSQALGKVYTRKHSTPYNHSNQGGYYFSITNNMFQFKSGLVVPAGETLYVECQKNMVTISGYYAKN